MLHTTLIHHHKHVNLSLTYGSYVRRDRRESGTDTEKPGRGPKRTSDHPYAEQTIYRYSHCSGNLRIKVKSN